MVGTCLLNRYELTGEFGRGGMGVVYRAHDRVLNRDVAVKILFVSHLTDAGEERFAREAQLVAQLDHPGVVPIYDFGRHEQTLFFVMPVVAGTTLDRRIRDRTLCRWEAIEIVAQVAEALDHSHARGVIHRDVKPQNIMVAGEEDGPRARILDFGIALGSAVSRLTQSGHLPGTVLYLSPEQITSETTDGRSDLYSLGTVLYECLIGRPPFQGSRFSLLYRIVHEHPPLLAVCGIDRELEELVLACLAKAPAARPRRGRDLAISLRRYLDTLGPEERGRKIPSSPPAAGPRSSGLELSGAEEPLVGRDREITELQGRLNAARDGECQLALIGGEIGMGKTRLLEELGRFAQLRGIRVLRSHFSDEAAFPYQGFCELIQDYFRGKEPPSSASSGIVDLGDLAPDLLALYPVLSEIRTLREAARGKTPSELAFERGDRRHLFEILARTLARLAGGKPVVFLLERLHAAEASIAALHYVVHRLGPTPTLVVGTYRPSAAPKEHPLRRLILGFQGNPRFCTLRLEVLSPSRHRDLVRHLLGRERPGRERPGRERPGRERPEVNAELAQRLYEATEGNPLFTRELVRSLLRSDGLLPDENGTWNLSDDSGLASDALPEVIQQIVGKRLEQLPEELLDTLTFASVLGRGFEFADLAALAADPAAGLGPGDRSEGKVDEAVDRLIQEGLLEEDRQSRSDRLHFSSRVVRDVLYGRLSRRKRRRLHRRHAAQLEHRYAGRAESIYPQLLHHYAAADVPEKTVGYGLKLAKQSLASCSAEDTVRAATIGIEFVESDELLDRGELEGELRYLLAAAYRLAGGIGKALAEIALAVRCFERAEAPERAAAAALVAAETAWQGRRVDDTRRWVQTGIRLARAVGAGETLRKLLTLGATVANMHGEYARGKVFLAEAAELARQASAPAEDLTTGGTAVTAVPNAVATRDREAFAPHHLETTDDLEILANVFETLLRSDADGRLVPWLGREWEGSAAGDAFRLTLRSDVRFSDATALITADVKRSF
ncbi:MAG: protein kinase, partial [bacterium]|nr:protein kinase [bacterium]